ncbi:MAG: hypothetical protein C4538_05565 [Nitrospiraceae bacterium]|nr:MAG: hypothetical protein C4538_05565 [Nitrospiraceae bacterium]
MRSKKVRSEETWVRGQGSRGRSINKIIILSLIAVSCLLTAYCYAEVLERIVAVVNRQVILLSELEEAYQSAVKVDGTVTGEKVLSDMIDRMLLLEQARRLRLGASDEDAADDVLLKQYVERRIKSFIYIPLDEIEAYYKQKREQFGKDEFYEVKDEIEDKLVDQALDKKLAEHIEELRKKASIRIQLE